MSEQEKDQANGDDGFSSSQEASDISIAEVTDFLLRQHTRLDERRRNAQLVQQYFQQLQHGCGRAQCDNVNCASSGKLATMTTDKMAAKAIELFTQDAKLCTPVNNDEDEALDLDIDEPTEDTPTTSAACRARGRKLRAIRPVTPRACVNHSSASPTSSSPSSASSTTSTSSPATTSSSSSSTSVALPLDHTFQWPPTKEKLQIETETETESKAPPEMIYEMKERKIVTLNDEIIDELIAEGEQKKSFVRLAESLNRVFGNTEMLRSSFLEVKEKHLKCNDSLKKEDIRALEGDDEKDVDSAQACNLVEECIVVSDWVNCASSTSSIDFPEVKPYSTSGATNVDMKSVRQCKERLYAIADSSIINAIINGIENFTKSIKYSLDSNYEHVLHCLLICFEFAVNTANQPAADNEFLEHAMVCICRVASKLPINAQARLARIWALNCPDCLIHWLRNCQTLITLQVASDEDDPREKQDVITLTKFLKIIFYANLLASDAKFAITKEDETAVDIEDDVFMYSSAFKTRSKELIVDKLEEALRVNSNGCRSPIIPFEEFYNEPLSDCIHMHRDYLSYRHQCGNADEMLFEATADTDFSFMLYSFILTPATKVTALYYDSRMRMFSERHSYSIYRLLSSEIGARPDLKLTVRRDNLISDALIGLEVAAMTNPKDLKKQLVVEFVGEQGIDEGGVSKEFFQLIVEEIFNPDFGMFVAQEETNTVWFNPTSFENGAQFTLVGILIGLAIYNNIILAVNFPMVVYRKLMNLRGDFNDLRDYSPILYNSLKSILDYEGADMETVFMQTFKISYNNVFSELIEHDLLPDGGNIAVNQANKQEFVDLYSDFLLNQCIEQQFKAFKKGFEMVTDESPLSLLFRPEEIELLVCGSKNFDFIELEKSTDYDGGYTAETQLIKDFWHVVHAMNDDSKRKLLEFTTGSDRIPVGGLSHLKLIITRHGPDTERLPTSHTCFNVLLLPEYSSKEKLEERLLKAINYSKGFGNL